MICDICNATMVTPAALLSTKEVVTSKECWKLYLANLIADGLLQPDHLRDSLDSLVGQMACSDTAWALCDTCSKSLIKVGFAPWQGRDGMAAEGHALCRSTNLMEFIVLDAPAVATARKAAAAAAAEIMMNRPQST